MKKHKSGEVVQKIAKVCWGQRRGVTDQSNMNILVQTVLPQSESKSQF